MKVNSDFSFQVLKHLGEISRRGNVSKEFNIVSFAGGEAKFDIRSWIQNGEEIKVGKGVTLDDDELFMLKQAIDKVYEQDINLPDRKAEFTSNQF